MQIKISFYLLIAELYLTDFYLIAYLDSFQCRFATFADVVQLYNCGEKFCDQVYPITKHYVL